MGVSPDAIRHYELGDRIPPLARSLAFEIVFGRPLAQLFPEALAEAASVLVDGAQNLSIEVEGKVDPASARKRTLLSAMNDRLGRIISLQ